MSYLCRFEFWRHFTDFNWDTQCGMQGCQISCILREIPYIRPLLPPPGRKPPGRTYLPYSVSQIVASIRRHCDTWKLRIKLQNYRGETRGLGRAKPSQPLKLAPPNTTDVAPPHMSYHRNFACWRFSHSRAGAAISRTLALLNSTGTNFI